MVHSVWRTAHGARHTAHGPCATTLLPIVALPHPRTAPQGGWGLYSTVALRHGLRHKGKKGGGGSKTLRHTAPRRAYPTFEVAIVLAFRGEVLWCGRLVRGRRVGCFSLVFLLCCVVTFRLPRATWPSPINKGSPGNVTPLSGVVAYEQEIGSHGG